MSPKVFLTGANGFVASHVLSGLVGVCYALSYDTLYELYHPWLTRHSGTIK